MKKFLRIIVKIIGFCLSVYFALYVMFVGGIIDVINQVKSPQTDALVVAWGVVKIVFASLSFYAGFMLTEIIVIVANVDD